MTLQLQQICYAVLLAAGLLPAAQPGLVEGNLKSTVRVVIYEDMQCSDCAHFRKMLDEELLPRYKATVAFEHRDFPLPKHDWARKAAAAARHFQSIEPQLNVRFRQFLFANLIKITGANFDQWLKKFARKERQDPVAALAAPGKPEYQQAVEKDYQEGVARGIAKTPTVLVNGQPFIETFQFEELAEAIEAELK
ncbi:MAG: thioredoxin domain-containing protein [Acidobacteria bacterium]|nr:thioredoxin domain-containing protein [Acidobacteriota bacterium]